MRLAQEHLAQRFLLLDGDTHQPGMHDGDNFVLGAEDEFLDELGAVPWRYVRKAEKYPGSQDEDGDTVLQQVPCAFLAADNACTIYDDRPKACREFPHTDRPKQAQILELTERNAAVCPAVAHIAEKLESVYRRLDPPAR